MRKFIAITITMALTAVSLASPLSAQARENNARNKNDRTKVVYVERTPAKTTRTTVVTTNNRSRQATNSNSKAKTRYVSRWSKGQRFDQSRARSYQRISKPAAYGLRNAPRGYYWARSDRDAVLVGLTSGIVASVIVGAFH